MDWGNLRQEDSAFMQFEHPVTGAPMVSLEGEPVGAVLVSIDSKQYRAKQSEVVNRRLSKKQRQPTAEQAEREGNELLAAATIEFKNLVIDGKEKTAKDAEEIYREFRWAREQVDRFVADRANFFTSAPSD